MANPHTLSDYLGAFYPDEQEPIHLRAFAPKKAPAGDARFTARQLVVTRKRLTTDKALQKRLRDLNSTRGLYFVVNAGGRTDAKITRFNAFFVEDDSRTIEEQHQRLDVAPLVPSIRIETLQSVHAYWLINGSCNAEEWRNVQGRLIAHFGGDEKIKNPSRVMRLGFFKHVHYDQDSGKLSRKRVEIVEFTPERKYTVAVMQEAFAPHPEAKQEPNTGADSQTATEFSSWEDLNGETKRRIRLSAKARTNVDGWTHAPGICHGSTDGTAIAVSPEGAYKCHKGCSTARVRAIHGLPERPNTPDREKDFAPTQPNVARVTSFSFTTVEDLIAEPKEEIAYVWDRTLPRGGSSICGAKPKAGKTTFAHNLAFAVSEGLDFFGRATVKGTVIFLCLEEKRAEVAERFRKMGATGQNIIIHTGRTPPNAITALEEAIEEYVPNLIIIEPLSRFLRIDDFSSYGEVTRQLEPVIDLARMSRCQPHIFSAHHNVKANREAGDALLGSTGFFGAVDTLLTMKRQKGIFTLETIQRYGEDLPETVVQLDDETGLIIAGGEMEMHLLSARKMAVLASLTDEEVVTETDIKARVTGSLGLTAKAVRRLVDEGLLMRTGAGKKGDPYLYQKYQDQVYEQDSTLWEF